MRTQQTLFRLASVAAIGGLMLGPVAAPFAHAQSEPAATPDTATPPADPPSRVGRIAALLGTVSFHTVDDTSWQAATPNYPVTSGNAFWTEALSSAELEVGPTHLAMDQQTEFDVDTLNDQTFAATAPQGSVYLRLRDVQPGDTTSVTTPRGLVSITAAGRYEIVAGDTDQPTKVTVLDGAAEIVVGDVTLHVAPRQTAAITGSSQDNFQGSVGVQTDDPFLQAQLAKERPAPARVSHAAVATATVAYQPPPLVEKMTGYDSIRDSGQWAPSPQYGHVWYPPVQRDWVPYRHGHWAFVAPWGWTWVDDAAWGFAPFHYGRWVQVDNRWGWVPVDSGVQVDVAVARPVYAPALVSFVDVAGAAVAGAAVGLAAGLALGGNVGWIPLGPREAYVPPFRASPDYVRNVNVTHINNVTNITNVNNVTNNTTTVNNFVNRGAATMVPAAAMTNSQPVAAHAQPVTARMLASAKPVFQAPVQPTAATMGYTPSVVRPPAAAPVATAPVAVPAAAARGTPPAAPVRPTSPGPAFAPRPAVAAMPAAMPAPKANAAPVPSPAAPSVTAPKANVAPAPAAMPAPKATPAPAPASAPAPLPALKPAATTAPVQVPPAAAAPKASAAPPAAATATPAVAPMHPALPALRPAAPAAKAPAATPAPAPMKPQPAPRPNTAPALAKPQPAPRPNPAPALVKPQPAPKPNAAAPVAHPVAPSPVAPSPAGQTPAVPGPVVHSVPVPHPATVPALKPLPPLPHPVVKPCPNGAATC